MNDPNEIINRLRELYRKKEYLGFYKSFMLSRFLLPKDISEKMETSAGYLIGKIEAETGKKMKTVEK
jgi:hypothetical protein